MKELERYFAHVALTALCAKGYVRSEMVQIVEKRQVRPVFYADALSALSRRGELMPLIALVLSGYHRTAQEKVWVQDEGDL